MDQGQRAAAILHMVAEAFQALESDKDVEQVICSDLAEALDADAAICFVPDEGGRPATLSHHPDRPATAALTSWAGAQARVSAGELPVARSDSELGHVLLVAPQPPDAVPAEGRSRSLAFARAAGFVGDDLALLREATPVLRALLPHAADATARRQRAEAGRSAAREYGLTARELEVLELLSQGLLATSIASRLSLSPRTVHKHLGNIYDKLGVHDRLVAVSLARGRGLVDD